MRTSTNGKTITTKPSNLVGVDKNDDQSIEEETKKKCEGLIKGYKQQLDEYITEKENLSIVEFITFGTTLTQSRLKFARTISDKIGEYLTAGNLFHNNNLRNILNLINRTIEANLEKTKEFLIVAYPGRLQNIMESARTEISNYCSQTYKNKINQSHLTSKVDNFEKMKRHLSQPELKDEKIAKNQVKNKHLKNKHSHHKPSRHKYSHQTTT